MRIVVANLTAGGLSGGYRKYLRRLMPLLADDSRVRQLTVFVPDPETAGIDRTIDVRAWSPDDARRRYAALSREIAALRPDVVFVPTARYTAFGSIPVVTMVRNMEPLTVPFGGNTWAEGLKNLARAWQARRASRRAARVIAVSNHVRDYVVSRWGIDASRVGTVYHGVDQRGSTTSVPGARRESFLFTAGSIRPARGLEDAIRALPLVNPDLQLVVAGKVDAGCAGYAERLRRMADTLGVSARIAWHGDLRADEMERAFLSSAAFLMTSRAEACPNIALEAMSSGCPSIAVEHAPMPEIFADAAVYYPAGNARALADQIRALIGNRAERERLAAAATKRAGAFTWTATCDRTIRELERSVS